MYNVLGCNVLLILGCNVVLLGITLIYPVGCKVVRIIDIIGCNVLLIPGCNVILGCNY